MKFAKMLLNSVVFSFVFLMLCVANTQVDGKKNVREVAELEFCDECTLYCGETGSSCISGGSSDGTRHVTCSCNLDSTISGNSTGLREACTSECGTEMPNFGCIAHTTCRCECGSRYPKQFCNECSTYCQQSETCFWQDITNGIVGTCTCDSTSSDSPQDLSTACKADCGTRKVQFLCAVNGSCRCRCEGTDADDDGSNKGVSFIGPKFLTGFTMVGIMLQYI